MSIIDNLKELHYLPKSDRRACLFILTITLLVISLLIFLSEIDTNSNPTTTKHKITQNDKTLSINRQTDISDNHKHKENLTDKKTETFYFDPNTADSTQLMRLGLHKWQVRNIYKYRAQGGVYQSKEDFAKVYGLTVKDYRRLAPYIRISKDYLPASTLVEVTQKQASTTVREQHKVTTYNTYSTKINKGEYVKINTSDTTILKKIPGIGSYYARQIIRYRNQLGGFTSKQQLLEIEGFPVNSLEYINIDAENIKKLNVNRMSMQQLRRHPYINYYQARAIADYRRLHGNIKNIKEICLLKVFTESDIKRLTPYLEY